MVKSDELVSVTYRRAEQADAKALSELAARLFVESYRHVMARAELEAHVASSFSADQQRVELADERITTFLALDSGIIGYAQLVVGNVPECGIEARQPAELKRIYVDHTWHGKGIAQELLQQVQHEAQDRACDQLWLAVWEINHRAISFYTRNGFRKIGRQGFPVGHLEQTDYVMAKPLANELR